MSARTPEDEQVMRLALGRIFRLASRPAGQDPAADVRAYYDARAAFLDAFERAQQGSAALPLTPDEPPSLRLLKARRVRGD